MVAVSVDVPEKSEVLRRELRLPFPILCDTERRVVQEWGIYNPQERGGIAKPAIFMIAHDRSVRYVSVDTVATRVPASEIIRVLQATAERQPIRHKDYMPRLADWFRGIRNGMRR